MRHPLVHLLITLILFFGLWAGLSSIPWTELFKVKDRSEQIEEKLSKLLWEGIQATSVEIPKEGNCLGIDSILLRLCVENDIAYESIQLHIINDAEINAFAIPGKRIIVFSGLISACENPDELAGVMAHELAHIQLEHVTKKLIKELSLAVLLSSGNSGGGEVVKEALKLLSSTAYDRKLEKEADQQAVIYLQQAHINPMALADFFHKMNEKEPDLAKNLTIISTHPLAEERAQYLSELKEKDSKDYYPSLPQEAWKSLKNCIGDQPSSD